MNFQTLNKEWNNSNELMLIALFISLCISSYFPRVCNGGSGGGGPSLERKFSLMLLHLPKFKINLKTLLLRLCFSQIVCLNNLHPNVIL